MIRARDIIEAYKASFRADYGRNKGDYAEVFSNPTHKEMLGLGNRIRFTADAEKKEIYVWNATMGTHDDANQRALDYPANWADEPVITGVARLSGSSYEFIDSDVLDWFRPGDKDDMDDVKRILSYDWSWAEKYIKMENFLDKVRMRFEL